VAVFAVDSGAQDLVAAQTSIQMAVNVAKAGDEALFKQQKNDLKESRYDEISNAQALLKEGKKIKPELSKYFSKDGRLLLNKVTESEEFDGFSCIFTTTNLPKEKVVKLYFDKDGILHHYNGVFGKNIFTNK
jgi:hypothetical protein